MKRLITLAFCLLASAPLSAQTISVEELDPVIVQPRVPESRERVERIEATEGTLTSLRGLDKVNGKSVDVEVQTGGTAEIFGLIVTLRECRYPTENPSGDAFAYLTIRDRQDGKVFFDGWMIASSPALNALDHRRYDVWVLRCKST
ncbi:DUF2155 domain-containing protein [Ruegeria sp. TM1040]|jgi:hypothetical protein|uniref:DUF2155 domain-containing protein n=1 Tax=Rhodobacterales TaxID=204455 RepID=UPI00004623EF|nr:DUF2155 domain-containing protein [Ruegeria sp. TM1040]ABF64253.1 hypothetical protein TM1040_1520 [Ruegeria sp. TM1040]MDF9302947.1 DUF2155 domain-containing protein [Tritonibacter mobilis]